MKFMDCRTRTNNDSIEIWNSRIYRKWNIINGLCHSVSLKCMVSGREHITKQSMNPAPSPGFEITEECTDVTIKEYVKKDSVVEEESLRLDVESHFPDYTIVSHFKIYLDTPAVSQWMSAKSRVPDEPADTVEQSVENIENLRALAKNTMEIRGLGDMLSLDRIHRKLGVVDFMAHTDRKDNLCSKKEDILTIHSTYAYSSNLFYLQNQLDDTGLIFLKESPLAHARPVKSDFDLLVDGDDFYFAGHGTNNLSEYPGYPFTVILYNDGEFGRMKALHDYQRRFRIYDEKRDDVIWHSTWGDRNADKIVSAPFMLKELDDMHKAGGDFLYFSDGWQKGAAMTPLSAERYTDQWSKPGYWDVDMEKFPNDLTEVIEKADEYGMMKGVWFCPDKTDEYANYKKDIEVLMELYKKYGFNKIKYDAMTFRTKLAEKRIKEVMAALVEGSDGNAFVEIDITAGIRTDYFDAMQYGFLFLENRYTDYRRYYPHLTLRNLWLLSHFIDPRRMRIEFLNNERNKDKYPDDPLAPYHYSPSYLYATTIFANPLMWFEISNLSDDYKREMKHMIELCRPVRRHIAKSNVYPIGDEPDGFSLSGFISRDSEDKGFACIYRAAGNESKSEMDVPLENGSVEFVLIAGEGHTEDAVKHGKLIFDIPGKYGFALFSYKQG